MDNTIIGAIIGASSAVLINGLIFLLSRSNEHKKDKIQIISELISNLHSQIRYARRFVGHQIWLNYYNRSLSLDTKPEFRSIVDNKIENRIKQIEDIEFRFIESDTRLSILSARYRSYFPKDGLFKERIEYISKCIISDLIKIESFSNWSDDQLREAGINAKVLEVEKNALETLKTSFEPKIERLIKYLGKKYEA